MADNIEVLGDAVDVLDMDDDQPQTTVNTNAVVRQHVPLPAYTGTVASQVAETLRRSRVAQAALTRGRFYAGGLGMSGVSLMTSGARVGGYGYGYPYMTGMNRVALNTGVTQQVVAPQTLTLSQQRVMVQPTTMQTVVPTVQRVMPTVNVQRQVQVVQQAPVQKVEVVKQTPNVVVAPTMTANLNLHRSIVVPQVQRVMPTVNVQRQVQVVQQAPVQNVVNTTANLNLMRSMVRPVMPVPQVVVPQTTTQTVNVVPTTTQVVPRQQVVLNTSANLLASRALVAPRMVVPQVQQVQQVQRQVVVPQVVREAPSTVVNTVNTNNVVNALRASQTMMAVNAMNANRVVVGANTVVPTTNLMASGLGLNRVSYVNPTTNLALTGSRMVLPTTMYSGLGTSAAYNNFVLRRSNVQVQQAQ